MIRDTSGQDIALDTGSRQRWMRLGLRYGVPALLVLAALVWMATRLSGAQRSVEAERLRFASVTRGAFVSDVSAQGRVVAAVSPTLYAPALGTVTLKVNAGERVQKGQVLAELTSPEIENEYAREDANLQGSRADYAREEVEVRTTQLQNQQTVDLAKVTVEAAERELKRAQDAHQLGVLPVMEVDRRADELVTAKVKYHHAQQEARLRNDSLGLQLKTRALEVERQELLVQNYRRRVEELRIVAPVDGVVGTLNVTQRQAVAANAPLMTVVDLSALEVEIQVPETYADSLGIDMPAEVRLGSQVYPGRLTAISPEVNNNQVIGRVAFTGDAPRELRQNQRVSTRIVLDSRDNVLQLPRGSFLDTGGGRSAYVVRDGHALRTPITVGAVAIDRVEILSGLEPGDQVVTSGDQAFENAEIVLIR